MVKIGAVALLALVLLVPGAVTPQTTDNRSNDARTSQQ